MLLHWQGNHPALDERLLVDKCVAIFEQLDVTARVPHNVLLFGNKSPFAKRKSPAKLVDLVLGELAAIPGDHEVVNV